jgi:uncharacterized protein (DUF885 family)
MTAVFRLCDDYVTRSAALDPVSAGMRGLSTEYGAATDFGPDGNAAREELIASTLAALAAAEASSAGVSAAEASSDGDRLAAAFLRERLEAELAWHRAGEPLRQLRAPFGLINMVRDSVDLLPRGGDADWRGIAARLAAIPAMFDGWRASLEAGLARGLAAARRQAVAPRQRPGPIADTGRSPATCARITRRGPPSGTGSGPSGTPWRPGSAWAPTSTWPRPTSGAGPSSAGSRPSWRPRRPGSARARAWTRRPRR